MRKKRRRKSLLALVLVCTMLLPGMTAFAEETAEVEVTGVEATAGSKVREVSLGDNHSAAIKEDGSLWMWGGKSYGQLGDGTTGYKHTPVKIMDGVRKVSLGYELYWLKCTKNPQEFSSTLKPCIYKVFTYHITSISIRHIEVNKITVRNLLEKYV